MTPRSYPVLLILTISFLGIMALGGCKPQTSTTTERATKLSGTKTHQPGSTSTTTSTTAIQEKAANPTTANPAAANAAVPPSKAVKTAKTGAIAAGASAAVAPTMPSTWKVQTDASISAAKIQDIAKHLGGAIQALRNTVYTVGDARVQINTIITASDDDAKKIVATLGRMKRPDTFLRQGTVIYEFVGNNAALPTIQAGRAHLAGR